MCQSHPYLFIVGCLSDSLESIQKEASSSPPFSPGSWPSPFEGAFEVLPLHILSHSLFSGPPLPLPNISSHCLFPFPFFSLRARCSLDRMDDGLPSSHKHAPRLGWSFQFG
jgi:hypothetical protein